jgi:hypothetical protein
VSPIEVFMRCPDTGRLFKDGFGAGSACRMWVDEKPEHKLLAGYDTARIVHDPDGLHKNDSFWNGEL